MTPGNDFLAFRILNKAKIPILNKPEHSTMQNICHKVWSWHRRGQIDKQRQVNRDMSLLLKNIVDGY